jgi:plastocyanin
MAMTRMVLAAMVFANLSIGGDLIGQVVITRKLSKKTVAPAMYNLRGTAPPVALVSSDDAVNEFAQTVVFVEGQKSTPLPPQSVVIEQRNSRFEPGLIVIPVGSTVQFPNSDPIFHNVFSLSKARHFDLGFYPQSKSKSVTFDQPGVVQIYCHIHASMYAAIIVTDSPWAEHLATTGDFVFHNMPAGHYRIVAWHKVAGAHGAEVDVPATGSAHVIVGVPIDEEHN